MSDDLLTRLHDVEEELLRRVRSAHDAKDGERVRQAGEGLEEVHRLRQTVAAVESAIASLEASLREPLREIGRDPVSGRPIMLKEGRFGPYVSDGETNASLRRGDSAESLTLTRAAELIAARRTIGPIPRRRSTAVERSDGAPTDGARSPADPRAHAAEQRRRILEQLATAGVPAVRISEAVHRLPSGTRLAMPFSAELEPGKWWLGSYEGRFDEVLLLCEDVEGVTRAFHLGRDVLATVLGRLSRDSKGNVKFNVDRIGGRYHLRVGGGQTLELSAFDVSKAKEVLR